MKLKSRDGRRTLDEKRRKEKRKHVHGQRLSQHPTHTGSIALGEG